LSRHDHRVAAQLPLLFRRGSDWRLQRCNWPCSPPRAKRPRPLAASGGRCGARGQLSVQLAPTTVAPAWPPSALPVQLSFDVPRAAGGQVTPGASRSTTPAVTRCKVAVRCRPRSERPPNRVGGRRGPRDSDAGAVASAGPPWSWGPRRAAACGPCLACCSRLSAPYPGPCDGFAGVAGGSPPTQCPLAAGASPADRKPARQGRSSLPKVGRLPPQRRIFPALVVRCPVPGLPARLVAQVHVGAPGTYLLFPDPPQAAGMPLGPGGSCRGQAVVLSIQRPLVRRARSMPQGHRNSLVEPGISTGASVGPGGCGSLLQVCARSCTRRRITRPWLNSDRQPRWPELPVTVALVFLLSAPWGSTVLYTHVSAEGGLPVRRTLGYDDYVWRPAKGAAAARLAEEHPFPGDGTCGGGVPRAVEPRRWAV